MGALLRGIKREEIRRGQVLAAPGTIKAAKKFMAQLYVCYSGYFAVNVVTYTGWTVDSDQGRRGSIYPFHAKLPTSMLHSNCRYHSRSDLG